jgi:hypothetical protein
MFKLCIFIEKKINTFASKTRPINRELEINEKRLKEKNGCSLSLQDQQCNLPCLLFAADLG